MKDDTTSVFVRLSKQEKENIEHCASELGVTINTYIKHICSTQGVLNKNLIKTNDLTEFTSELALFRRRIESILRIAEIERTITKQDIEDLKQLLNEIENKCAAIQEDTFKLRKKIRDSKNS